MILNFNTHGNEKQKACARAWVDPTVADIVYGGAKGGAKSYTGSNLIFGDALLYPETHYFIARESLNDLRKFTLPSIFEVFQHWGLGDNYYKFNGQDNYFKMHNDSKVYLLEARYLPSDPLYERFGSMQMTRGWIEEAGQVKEAAKNNLAASIGRWKNDEYNLAAKLLQTCNPAKNYLYSKYYKPFRDGTLEPHKRFIQALPSDNKMLSKGYIENLIRSLSPTEKLRLINGNWEYDDDPATLIPYDHIVDIFSNKNPEPGLRYVTADVARFGADKTVIMVWEGWNIIKVVTMKGADTTQVAQRIKELQKEFNVRTSCTIVDEDGIGGGVKDQLPGIYGFIANSTPKKIKGKIPNYDNLKSQCYFLAADKVNKHLVGCACPEIQELLTEELEQVKKKSVDVDQKQGVVPKDKVKEMIGRSPDYSDNFAFRAYFDLRPPAVWH